MKKLSLPIIIVAILVVGYLVFTARPADNQNGTVVQSSPTPTNGAPIDTSNWKTYRNENIGIEFKHPIQNLALPYERQLDQNAEVLDQYISSGIYIKAFQNGKKLSELYQQGLISEDIGQPYFNASDYVSRELEIYETLRTEFEKLINLSSGSSCSIYKLGFKAVGPGAEIYDTCRTFISDSGVTMATQFFTGYRGPHYKAFFLTTNYQIYFIVYELGSDLLPELRSSGEISLSDQEILATRMFQGEFPQVNEQLNTLRSLLRTVRVLN